MKRLTFEVLANDAEPVLIEEHEFDDKGLLLYERIHGAEPPTEKAMQYNSAGKLILEIEASAGVELNRCTYRYNDKGETIEFTLSIAGELYERKTITYREDGFQETTWREHEEVESVEHFATTNKSLTRTFEQGVVSGYESSEYFPESKLEVTQFFDDKDQLYATEKRIFDSQDRILERQEIDVEDNLLVQWQYVYDGELLMQETYRDYKSTPVERQMFYTYDSNSNLVRTETRTLSGNVIGFAVMHYDARNNLVEEKGLDHQGPFHLRYQYQE